MYFIFEQTKALKSGLMKIIPLKILSLKVNEFSASKMELM